MNIEKLKAACAALPNEEWRRGAAMEVGESFTDGDTMITEIVNGGGAFVACVNHPNPDHAAILDFIVEARPAVPKLLALYQAVERAIDPDGDLRTMDLSEIVDAMRDIQASQDPREALLKTAGYTLHDNGTGTGWYALPPGEIEFIHDDEAGRHSYLGFFSSKEDLLAEIHPDLSSDVMGYHSIDEGTWAGMRLKEQCALAATRLTEEFPPATYFMELPLTPKVWFNRGGGWEHDKDYDDFMLPRGVDRYAAAKLLSAELAKDDFSACVRDFTLPEVTGGEIAVAPDMHGLLVKIHTRFALDEARLQELRGEVLGQLSDGLYENMDAIELAKWDDGRHKDYMLSVVPDYDKCTSPELEKRAAKASRRMP